jgi:excisionase family DNA binding protein
MVNQPAPRYASLKHAAEYVDGSEITIRRMIARGELTKHKLGRVLRVDLNEVDAAIRSDVSRPA